MNSTPRVIEFVGPAGAGKSTLARALVQRSERVVRELPPCWRDPRQIPFFAWNTVAALPTYAQLLSDQRRNPIWRGEFLWTASVRGWPARLQHPRAGGKEYVIVDQGPISILAVTEAHSTGLLSGPRGEEWRCRMYRQLSHVFYLVFLLDAPNDILIPRIRTRPQTHDIKAKSDELAAKQLDNARRAYDRAISIMTMERSDLQVYRLNTAKQSVDEECDLVSEMLGLNHSERDNGHHSDPSRF